MKIKILLVTINLTLIYSCIGLGCQSTNSGEHRLQSEPSALFDKIVAEVHKANPQQSSVPLNKILTRDNFVRKAPLIRGQEIFGAYAELIRNAKKEILIQSFVWETDASVHDLVMDALESLCQSPGEPITLRILVNDVVIKPTKVHETIKSELDRRCAGSKRLSYETLAYMPPFVVNLLHSKYIVVDGMNSIITGANIQKTNDPDKEPWYDLGFQVFGPNSQILRQDFIDAWVRAKTYLYTPAHSNVVNATAHLFGFVPENLLPDATPPADLKENYIKNVPILFIGQFGNGNLLSPNKADSPQGMAYQAVFDYAKKNIHLQSPNFNADPAWYGVLGAVQRNVEVKMILSKGFNFWTESIPGQKGNNFTNVRDLYKELGDFQHPVYKAYWYGLEEGAPVQGTPGLPVFATGPNKSYSSHAKYLSADGEIAIIGSANLDTQTWYRSREASLVVHSPELVREWESYIFMKNLKHAIPICKAKDKNGCAYTVPPPEGPFW